MSSDESAKGWFSELSYFSLGLTDLLREETFRSLDQRLAWPAGSAIIAFKV